MKKQDHNIIPRNATRIVAEQIGKMSAGRPGDIWDIWKVDGGWHGVNRSANDGKRYWMFTAHLRIKELYRFIEVEKEA